MDSKRSNAERWAIDGGTQLNRKIIIIIIIMQSRFKRL
jgi:hypothetical protein